MSFVSLWTLLIHVSCRMTCCQWALTGSGKPYAPCRRTHAFRYTIRISRCTSVISFWYNVHLEITSTHKLGHEYFTMRNLELKVEAKLRLNRTVTSELPLEDRNTKNDNAFETPEHIRDLSEKATVMTVLSLSYRKLTSALLRDQ